MKLKNLKQPLRSMRMTRIGNKVHVTDRKGYRGLGKNELEALKDLIRSRRMIEKITERTLANY